MLLFASTLLHATGSSIMEDCGDDLLSSGVYIKVEKEDSESCEPSSHHYGGDILSNDVNMKVEKEDPEIRYFNHFHLLSLPIHLALYQAHETPHSKMFQPDYQKCG